MHRSWFLILGFCLVFISIVRASGLSDEPLLGDSLQYLDGDSWTARGSSGLEIAARVPGDIITDLQRANIIEDPYFELNWINNATLWDLQDWTYQSTFSVMDLAWLKDPSVLEIYLVFDGVKMAADLSLNGQALGTALNQFLRYTFPVKSLLNGGSNQVQVSFAAYDPRIDPEVRFMACAGGWDWAPYSAATGITPGKVRTFGKGIWKSVYLVPVRSAAIAHVVPKISYAGDYPSAPLGTSAPGAFFTTVSVHFLAPAATTGELTVLGQWNTTPIQNSVSIPAGTSIFNVTLYVPPAAVSLWWPNGMGSQTLYSLNVSFAPSSSSALPLSTSRSVGFRIFALVTDDDSSPSRLEGQDGSGNLTMRFKVNGANIFSRGSNFIPMDELDGRANARALYFLMKSAADAGMNTIRIWGGGVWEYDAFYDAADEFGLLLFHDMMYSDQADSFHMAAPTAMQAEEIQYQIRRLSHHPSIVLWDGCNECSGSGVFESFVMPTIAAEDPSRAIWPSCPSSGWQSGVDRLYSLPNSSPAGLHIKLLPNPVINKTGTGYCQQGGWYHGFPITPFLTPFPSPSAEGCMASCANTSGCVCGMYGDLSCQLKGFEWLVPSWGGEGLWACFPDPNFPIPAMPLPSAVEQHGPYFGGAGWPTTNNIGDQLLDPLTPTTLLPIPSAYGPSAPGVFTSEFGVVTLTSFESLSATLRAEHWSLHGGMPADNCTTGDWKHTCSGANPMAQRNYACDNFWNAYYGSRPVVTLDDVGADALKAQTYLCQLASALQIKGNVEWHRGQNLYGLMVWQLNEIWPTAGWGSLEYGTPYFTSNQVIGGRWKPTHYFYRSMLCRDVFAACGKDGRCYVKNDNALAGFVGSMTLTFVHLKSGATSTGATFTLNLAAGANAISWFCASGGSAVGTNCTALSEILSSYNCAASGADCLLLINVLDSTGNVVFQNPSVLSTPGNISIGPANVFFKVGPYQPNSEVSITVSSDAPALFISLTTLASGRFSENSFNILSPGATTITFVPFDDFDYDQLITTLRIEHLGQYLR